MTVPGYTSECQLCRLIDDGELLTRLVLEDDNLMVVDCLVCQVPMAVLKVHRASFNQPEKELVREFFAELLSNGALPLTDEALSLLNERGLIVDHPADQPWVIDWEQRQIPGHAHCHLRPCAFPGTTLWERIKPAGH